LRCFARPKYILPPRDEDFDPWFIFPVQNEHTTGNSILKHPCFGHRPECCAPDAKMRDSGPMTQPFNPVENPSDRVPQAKDDKNQAVAADENIDTSSGGDPEFAQLDQLYRQALDAMKAVESNLDLPVDAQRDTADSTLAEESQPTPGSAVILPMEAAAGSSTTMPSIVDQSTAGVGVTDLSDEVSTTEESSRGEATARITPRQVIEALLFVGGRDLTTKRLCSLLRGEFDQDFVQSTVNDLNTQYAAEGRPYEIRFGEGGYRLALKQEFERVQGRVYGLGPKEIKLSQESLELLAIVAYKQPITKQEIDEIVHRNSGGVLRQLLRRELILIQRGENDERNNVSYRTAPRFLQLFGLTEIGELPQADEFDLK
jgi:segregation and condensation protein B